MVFEAFRKARTHKRCDKKQGGTPAIQPVARHPRNTMVQRDIATYEHPDEEHVNNPPTGLVTPETDGAAGSTGGRIVPRATFDPRGDTQAAISISS